MHIVVIGLGQVGRHIIQTLENERHDLIAVDQDPEVIEWIGEHHDVATLTGYGASQKILDRAGVRHADLVVAVTSHDEANLIAALAARRLGCKRAIARVEGTAWADLEGGVQYNLLGVDAIVNPRVLIAEEISKIARSHGALEVIDLANERIELVQVELVESSRMLHKPLAKLQLPPDILVGAVVREGELFVPGGADVLLPGDRVYLIGRRENMVDAEDLFTRTREAHRVCIVGGGVVGRSLARALTRDTTAEVAILEQDHEVALQLAAELEGATVIHGDGTDLELLRESEVDKYDLVAATTHEDEINLMASLLAKRAGAKRTVAIVHRPDYTDIYRQLGIDVVLSPRIVASDHILRFCRGDELRSVSVLEDGRAEVLELVAREGCRAIGVPLRRMNMPRGSLLAAIIHGEQVIIPRGDDKVRAGDTVILLSTAAARAGVERMFRQRAF